MKYLYILLLLIASSEVFPQSNLAIINDPDGYTNVRSGPGGNTKVLGKIFEGEIFWIETEKYRKGSWWTIMCNCKEGFIEGYMHKSRILALDDYPKFHMSDSRENTLKLEADELEIIFTVKSFDTQAHEILKREDGSVEKIDGATPYGVDGSIPTKELIDVLIETEEGAWHLSQDDIKSIFEPNLSRTWVYRLSEDRMFMVMENSDGAGFYTVIWEISKHDLENRTILEL
ncbi:MAG: hypothetical protein AAF696_17310 [Bacteroidota bacterium]